MKAKSGRFNRKRIRVSRILIKEERNINHQPSTYYTLGSHFRLSVYTFFRRRANGPFFLSFSFLPPSRLNKRLSLFFAYISRTYRMLFHDGTPPLLFPLPSPTSRYYLVFVLPWSFVFLPPRCGRPSCSLSWPDV